MSTHLPSDWARTAVPVQRDDQRADPRDFSWSRARSWLGGLPGDGGLNMGYEALDRHVRDGLGSKVAIRSIEYANSVREWTYGELATATARFANVLSGLGVSRGSRVAALLGNLVEAHVAALGTLKHGTVHTPLAPGLGPELVAERLSLADARVLVTTPSLYAAKVAPVRYRLPRLRHVLLVGREAAAMPRAMRFDAAMSAASERFDLPDTDPQQPALLHFTSGTGGQPHAVVHDHDAVVAQFATSLYGLDLGIGDVFWCTAEPGWMLGTYGLLAPLLHGATMLNDTREFDAYRWYQQVEQHRVSVCYTEPFAIHRLMRQGSAPPAAHDLTSLRHVASTGEPLDANAVRWGIHSPGVQIHDTWWQTETGAIMIGGDPGVALRPGSMGRPLPGVRAEVLAVDADGAPTRRGGSADLVRQPGVVGELALRAGWPSMFRGYLNDEEAYRARFVDDWYRSGDLVTRDEDGYFWFFSRAEQVIVSHGHLVGTFEVEKILREHPAVGEVGVIGVPGPDGDERICACVALAPGSRPSERLRLDLLTHGRAKLGSMAPELVAFHAQLPHGDNGKVLHRLLRARALKLGDTNPPIPNVGGP